MQDARIQALFDLGIISSTVRDQAQADPRLHELERYPGLSLALLWLVTRHLLTEKELAATETELRRFTGEAHRERQTVIDEMKAHLLTVKHKQNMKSLQTLCESGLLSDADFQALSPNVPNDVLWSSAAAALAWRIEQSESQPEELAALKVRAKSSPTASRIVAEAEKIYVQDMLVNSQPGSGWLSLLHLAASVCGFGVAYEAFQMRPGWGWTAGLVICMLLIQFCKPRVTSHP